MSCSVLERLKDARLFAHNGEFRVAALELPALGAALDKIIKRSM